MGSYYQPQECCVVDVARVAVIGADLVSAWQNCCLCLLCQVLPHPFIIGTSGVSFGFSSCVCVCVCVYASPENIHCGCLSTSWLLYCCCEHRHVNFRRSAVFSFVIDIYRCEGWVMCLLFCFFWEISILIQYILYSPFSPLPYSSVVLVEPLLHVSLMSAASFVVFQKLVGHLGIVFWEIEVHCHF